MLPNVDTGLSAFLHSVFFLGVHQSSSDKTLGEIQSWDGILSGGGGLSHVMLLLPW